MTFDHIDSLRRIINIEFTNCGILHNVSNASKIFLKSAIFIYNSRNVTIWNTLDGSGLVCWAGLFYETQHQQGQLQDPQD